ncbi:AAA family ATPase [Intestinibacter sp.]|uniref:AAA family ATPase n=1 Tax=Intestinibacter sp. TaxID=1965304 RepID=UPI003F177B93
MSRIQGSGKTTYAKQWVLEDPENRVRFNNDDIRNMLGKYWVPSREELVSNLKEAFLSKAMGAGYDIIVDNMNLNEKEIKYYNNFVTIHNQSENLCSDIFEGVSNIQYTIKFKDFFIPLEECIRRDSLRENPIGEEVIRSTYERYKYIIEYESEKS